MEIKLTNGRVIDVDIQKKQVKYLRLKINSQGEISLSIPKSVSNKKAQDFVVSKSKWIIDTLNKYPKKVLLQNHIRIMGVDYPYVISENTKNSCLLQKDTLYIYLQKGSNYEKVLEKWQKENAYILFDAILNEYYPLFESLGVKKPVFCVRKMKTIWGSCSTQKGTIRLNFHLYAAPLECIRYVVFHELTHLIYANHGASFKNFLTQYMPHWKLYKQMLFKEIL